MSDLVARPVQALHLVRETIPSRGEVSWCGLLLRYYDYGMTFDNRECSCLKCLKALESHHVRSADHAHRLIENERKRREVAVGGQYELE